jgi:hypothetical protein
MSTARDSNHAPSRGALTATTRDALKDCCCPRFWNLVRDCDGATTLLYVLEPALPSESSRVYYELFCYRRGSLVPAVPEGTTLLNPDEYEATSVAPGAGPASACCGQGFAGIRLLQVTVQFAGVTKIGCAPADNVPGMYLGLTGDFAAINPNTFHHGEDVCGLAIDGRGFLGGQEQLYADAGCTSPGMGSPMNTHAVSFGVVGGPSPVVQARAALTNYNQSGNVTMLFDGNVPYLCDYGTYVIPNRFQGGYGFRRNCGVGGTATVTLTPRGLP